MKRLITSVAVAAALTTAAPSFAAKRVRSNDPVTVSYSCSDGVFSWSWIYGLLSGGATSSAAC